MMIGFESRVAMVAAEYPDGEISPPPWHYCVTPLSPVSTSTVMR